ncbi:HAD-IIB family hydrolase [Halomonas aquamarina]|uniref:HAD-IIB family hydrolase n=1 Tax=Vreelandella aquamarina TaxID=77097 RepID=A0ACC5VYT5_9GAMM|nr:HAD-IIB family hydrolase [Halomonas aquamarina]MBZ5489130.1 HAD-IIB family hydrolase [Halomonas aquamarina]
MSEYDIPASFARAPDAQQRARLVFTDLDGSLLDHHSYDFSPALPTLAWLEQLRIPVIPVTSKTRAELLPLRESLGLVDTPFVAENGAVIGLPPGWCHARLDRPSSGRDGLAIKHTGVDIGFIRARLNVWRKRLNIGFTCMGEMSNNEVAALTGLDAARASDARQREGCEPLIWNGDQASLETFRQALESDGLELTQGGRFWHVMGRGTDKGRAVTWLIERFAMLRGCTPLSLALGDGPNDVSMLEAVDQAVVIQGVHDARVTPRTPALYRTTAVGPAGWAEGVTHWWGGEEKPLQTLSGTRITTQ